MWKERHFVEIKTMIMHHALGMQECPWFLNMWNEFVWVFSYVPSLLVKQV